MTTQVFIHGSLLKFDEFLSQLQIHKLVNNIAKTQVLQSNGYDNATIRGGSKELPSKDHTDTEQEKGSILTIPYIAGLSESIQRVCRDFDIKQHLSWVRH